MAGGPDQHVRQKVFPQPVRAHLYGASLSGRHGVVAAAQPERGYNQRIPSRPVRPSGQDGPSEHLYHRRHDLGADNVLLPLRVHHHQPGHGKDGSVPGGGRPHLRRVAPENRVYHHASHDDSQPDRGRAAGVCMRGELLRHSLDRGCAGQGAHRDHPHC